MKKQVKKTFVLLAAIIAIFFIASCKKNNNKKNTYQIKYELNGGTNSSANPTEYTEGVEVSLAAPTKDGNTFGGWYTNKDLTGSAISKISATTKGDLYLYAKWTATTGGDYEPKWTLNQINFNGNGMKFLIKVKPVEEFDPFVAGYTGDHKIALQTHLSMVESAYSVDIVYSEWNDNASWGPDRVKFIKDGYVDGSLNKSSVYVVNIASQWIPTLVKAKALAPLTDAFKEAGYEQAKAVSESMTVNKKVYGYAPGTARPDNFLYYNVGLVNRCGVEDPAELWFKGQWTWSKFKEWVRSAQTELAKVEPDGKVIDAGAAEFFIGATAAQGLKLVNAQTSRVLFAGSKQAAIFDEMRTLYKGGFWSTSHGTSDVTTDFLTGKTIMATGSLWFVKDTTRFDQSKLGDDHIGVVPYPMDDSNDVKPYTAPYSYTDSEGNTVEVKTPLKKADGKTTLTTDAGEPIYGLDMTNSSKFFIPYTGTSNYSIMNFQNGANNITPEVAFHIMYDLVSGVGKDPEEKVSSTADEAYYAALRKKFDETIFCDVVMSVQDSSLTYYELMETLSMTVGGGSHFGENGFWPIAASIIKGDDSAAVKLKEIQAVYTNALAELGL